MMYDPHEELHLELPEINRNNIEDNHYDIIQNRIMLAGLCALTIAMVIGSHIVLKHDLHDCQEKTAKHIMGDAYTPIHKDMFESQDE